jgi:hypothetical protein
MPDILADAAAWLNGMRRTHMSRHVAYSRAGVSSPCLATVSQSVFETQSEMGVIERWESRDFLISMDDLPVDSPQRGDRIVETIGPTVVTYEVCAPRGSPVWKYADPFRTCVRVFTKAVGESQS